MIRIALLEPEIPQNTGNIARLCAATGAPLYLVGKLGFSLDEKHVRRAGMDYWHSVDLHRIDTVEQFFADYADVPKAFISVRGKKNYTEIPEAVALDGFLVFGRESTGLPEFAYTAFADDLYRIPMIEGMRSLNLSNTAALVLYSLLAKADFAGLV